MNSHIIKNQKQWIHTVHEFIDNKKCHSHHCRKQKKMCKNQPQLGGKCQDNSFLMQDWNETQLQYCSIYALRTYDVNKTWAATRGWDRHMVTVIGGWLLFKNITTAEWEVEKKEQLALHMSEQKFQNLRRKMTFGVTDGLWRITLKSSSIFLDRLGIKRVVLQHMYLGCNGEHQKSPKKRFMSEKQSQCLINATVHTVLMIWLRQRTKHMNNNKQI